MASLAAGDFVGVARAASITNVKWIDGVTAMRASALFEALLYVLNDVMTRGLQGKAVISFSHGKEPPISASALILTAHLPPPPAAVFGLIYLLTL
jgi:hypothetical protein